MLARNVTLEQLQQAAREVGVRLYGGRYGTGPCEHITRNGPEYRFTLRTGSKTERRPDWRGKLRRQARYSRLSQLTRTSRARETYGARYSPTVPGAVCFHGHRDFYRALYRLAPHAWIRTAKATYTSAEQFEATYRDAGYNPNAGNGLVGLIPYDQACTCDERGRV